MTGMIANTLSHTLEESGIPKHRATDQVMTARSKNLTCPILILRILIIDQCIQTLWMGFSQVPNADLQLAMKPMVMLSLTAI